MQAQAPVYGPSSLRGTNIVIFGGSSGIGKAVAVSAAQQGAAKIHILGRSADKLSVAKGEIEAAGSDVTVLTTSLDVTDEVAVRSFFAELPEESLDHLITTPGGSAKLGDLIANNRTCDDVRRQMDLKFYAQLAPVLAVGTKIKAGGSIVMTSGVLSRRPGKGNDALAVANGAIETMVKVLACDQGYEGRKVRVNCLSPGMTLTPVYGDSEQARQYQAKMAGQTPLQRNALPAEMAHAVTFLMTNTFVTGLVLDCDGGHMVQP